ncbi:MAG TPA: hypothetical protein VLT36_07160 [Candidatus Dormibacteraeota bacterium]|nr:hypothetical protein [Candidatus Dormibacteraeota bacterium]
MTATPAEQPVSVGALLRGEARTLQGWLERWETKRVALCIVVILAGAGLYGAAMGWWRAPLQALFVGIKFPLVLLLTALGNALINAMLAPLLGLNIGFRQSLLAVLMSFTILAAILGSFSPITAYVIWNSPPLSNNAVASEGTYRFIQLMHVGIIAFAGTTANLRLMQLLRQLSGNVSVARRVLFSWLGCNLFLGSQLFWIFRPFIGTPDLAIQFLRPDAFKGNFYETVLMALKRLFELS